MYEMGENKEIRVCMWFCSVTRFAEVLLCYKSSCRIYVICLELRRTSNVWYHQGYGEYNFLDMKFVSRSEVSHNIDAKKGAVSDLHNLVNDCQSPSSNVHNVPKVPPKVLNHSTP